MDGEPLNPTKPYRVRLDALRELEKLLRDLDIPVYMIFDFPQQASSFDNDPWQPILLVGDLAATKAVKYLYSDTRDRWFYAVDEWHNNRGDDAGQVADELKLWWTEILAGGG